MLQEERESVEDELLVRPGNQRDLPYLLGSGDGERRWMGLGGIDEDEMDGGGVESSCEELDRESFQYWHFDESVLS